MYYVRKLILALVGGLVAAGLFFAARTYPSKSAPSDKRELHALRSDFEQLSSKLEAERRARDQVDRDWRRELERNSRKRPSQEMASVEPAQAATAPPSGDGSITSVDAESAPSTEEVVAQIDSAFQSERIDPAWSPRALESIRGHYTGTLPEHASIQSSECRGTLCRVQLTMPDQIAYRKFVEATFHNPDRQLPENSASVYGIVEESPDKLVMVAYTARAGAQVPVPEVEPTLAHSGEAR